MTDEQLKAAPGPVLHFRRCLARSYLSSTWKA
jgi:hypothetical protein